MHVKKYETTGTKLENIEKKNEDESTYVYLQKRGKKVRICVIKRKGCDRREWGFRYINIMYDSGQLRKREVWSFL